MNLKFDVCPISVTTTQFYITCIALSTKKPNVMNNVFTFKLHFGFVNVEGFR